MILIAAVGQKQPGWVNEAFTDYAARFPPDFPVQLKEIKAEPRNTGKTVAEIKKLEAERLRGATLPSSAKVLLDETGKAHTTQEFETFLFKLIEQHRDISFLIGGPDGFDENFKSECQHQIRLSSMTLPHGLARVLLIEQIYRAWSLHKGHPYHRGGG